MSVYVYMCIITDNHFQCNHNAGQCHISAIILHLTGKSRVLSYRLILIRLSFIHYDIMIGERVNTT